MLDYTQPSWFRTADLIAKIAFFWKGLIELAIYFDIHLTWQIYLVMKWSLSEWPFFTSAKEHSWMWLRYDIIEYDEWVFALPRKRPIFRRSIINNIWMCQINFQFSICTIKAVPFFIFKYELGVHPWSKLNPSRKGWEFQTVQLQTWAAENV